MTRGSDTTERKGLHASAVIVSDDKFCYRQQVLSLFYKQLQGEQTKVGLKRIFAEGDAIHEKWQRLFIRGGLCAPLDCDYSRFDEDFDLSYTPDIICKLPANMSLTEPCDKWEEYIVEIKSVNTYTYKNKSIMHLEESNVSCICILLEYIKELFCVMIRTHRNLRYTDMIITRQRLPHTFADLKKYRNIKNNLF